MLAGNSEAGRRFPFVEAPEWRKLAVPKQTLHQVWHGSDLVKLVDSILVGIVVEGRPACGGEATHGARHGTESTHRLGLLRSERGERTVLQGRRVHPARSCCGPRHLGKAAAL